MDERTAFVGRELWRTLAEVGDVDAAYSRLSAVLPAGPNKEALERLKRDLDSATGLRHAGDGERDWLRVAVRIAQLIRENSGASSPEVWTEMERHYTESRALAASLSQSMIQGLALSMTTAAVALVVAVLYVVFVLPQFQALFASLGAELPEFTTRVLGAGGVLVIALLALIALAILGFPIRPTWARRHGLGRWRLDLFSRRAVFGREVAADFRKLLFVSYAAGLSRGGLSDGLSLTLANRETGVFRDLDVERREAPARAADPFLDALLAASELGHFREELATQRHVRMTALNESAERLQLRAALGLRSFLYLLVGALIVAMYLPIFKLGAAI